MDHLIVHGDWSGFSFKFNLKGGACLFGFISGGKLRVHALTLQAIQDVGQLNPSATFSQAHTMPICTR